MYMFFMLIEAYIHNLYCRPGTYEHDVSLGRQVEVDEAFGTSRTLHNAVVMKCTKGIPDTVSGTAD